MGGHGAVSDETPLKGTLVCAYRKLARIVEVLCGEGGVSGGEYPLVEVVGVDLRDEIHRCRVPCICRAEYSLHGCLAALLEKECGYTADARNFSAGINARLMMTANTGKVISRATLVVPGSYKCIGRSR